MPGSISPPLRGLSRESGLEYRPGPRNMWNCGLSVVQDRARSKHEARTISEAGVASPGARASPYTAFVLLRPRGWGFRHPQGRITFSALTRSLLAVSYTH